MSDFERGAFAIFCYTVAGVAIISLFVSIILEKVKERAKKKQEEAQKDAWENPQLQAPPVVPAKKAKKPVDPDDIQISGPIPIITEEDVSQSKTQPIPVVTEGAASETKILQVQDHILESFYRKISDPKSYDWNDLPDDFRARFGINAMPMFGAYAAYDTGKITPNLTEVTYFMIPIGQAGKTALETNLMVGGVIVLSPHTGFVFKTTVIRFTGDVKKEDIKRVLEGGVYEFMDGSTHTRPIQSPLSTFVPLNPFDQEPKVFFLVHKDVFLRDYSWAHASVLFPRGLGPVGLFELKIELPGITVRPNYKPVQY
jgi:hypothetical protein